MEAAEIQVLLSGISARLSVGVKRAFDHAGAYHQRQMAQRFKPYGSGDPIQTRSGALRRSFGWATRGTGLGSELTMFSQGTKYARAQEFGGTIRPKRARFLTVPLSDALTGSGALKGGARLVNRGGHWETADGERTFIFRSKRGALLVAARTAQGRLRLLYTLKPSVTLKPRLGFRSTFETLTEPFLRKTLEREAKAALA